MPVHTTARVLANGHLRAAQAETLHGAIRVVVRSLLSVDDSTLDLPLRQLKVCSSLYGQHRVMSEIGRELGISPSAMTQVSNRLERRGLVERVNQNEDRRVRKLKLTKKGQQLMRSRENKQLRRIAAALDAASPEQIQQITSGLELLARVCKSQQNGH